MKKIILGLNLILIFSLTGFGQKTEQIKGPSAQTNGNASLAAGTSLEAQLQQSLDVRSAKVGDQVILKTTKAIKQNGKTVVDKGSKLIGRVTEVQQKTKNNAFSKLGLVFDRIHGQDLNLPISATIVSITNAAANASLAGSDLSGTADTDTRVMGQSSSNSNNSSGGGLLGGVTGTVGSVVNTTTNTVSNTTGVVRQTAGNTVGTVGNTINGIRIMPSVSAGGSANSSTTLSAANKDLRVEKGANFQLQLHKAGGN